MWPPLAVMAASRGLKKEVFGYSHAMLDNAFIAQTGDVAVVNSEQPQLVRSKT